MKKGILAGDVEWVRVPVKTRVPGYAFVARTKDELGQAVDVLVRFLNPAHSGKEGRHV